MDDQWYASWICHYSGQARAYLLVATSIATPVDTARVWQEAAIATLLEAKHLVEAWGHERARREAA